MENGTTPSNLALIKVDQVIVSRVLNGVFEQLFTRGFQGANIATRQWGTIIPRRNYTISANGHVAVNSGCPTGLNRGIRNRHALQCRNGHPFVDYKYSTSNAAAGRKLQSPI